MREDERVKRREKSEGLKAGIKEGQRMCPDCRQGQKREGRRVCLKDGDEKRQREEKAVVIP